MSQDTLFSAVLELRAQHDATIPSTAGELAHALFFNLLKQFNSALSVQLHGASIPRPFTLAPLSTEHAPGKAFQVKRGQSFFLRLTLLDGGPLWDQLSTYFLESETIPVCLGSARFVLTRIITSPAKDPHQWAQTTSWQHILSLPACNTITFYFSSPTAFSIGKRTFALVPKPQYLWESLLRVWNTYAPDGHVLERQAISSAIEQAQITSCDLHIDILYFSSYVQKGFVGKCTYAFPLQVDTSIVTRLAAFAYYSGMGYKTTMGMGQVRVFIENISSST